MVRFNRFRVQPKMWLQATLVAIVMVVSILTGSRTGLADERPNLYLLAIGVSTYEKPLPGLPFADDDARSLLNWSEGQEGRYYNQIHRQLLVNDDARRELILKAVDDLVRQAKSSDTIMIFFAGHGVLEGESYYFLPRDVKVTNIVGTGVRDTDVLSSLRRQGGPNVIILVDTCHAGALSEVLPPGARGLESGTLKVDTTAEGTQLSGVLSAGTASELAVEGAEYRLPNDPPSIGGHGLFSWALLRGLGSLEADSNQDGLVSTSELIRFVTDEVARTSGGRQRPVPSGDFPDVPLGWAPGTQEQCDNRDNDLDGLTDEGFPDINQNHLADCLEDERCNGMDDNADGRIDEGFDQDGDGHLSLEHCGPAVADDCDDLDRMVHPDQADWDNGRDDDCDGLYDEEGLDLDRDGYADSLQNRRRLLRLESLGLVGLAVATTTLAVTAQDELNDKNCDWSCLNPIPETTVQKYRRLSLAVVSLSTISVSASGVAIGLAGYSVYYSSHYLRPSRSLEGGSP